MFSSLLLAVLTIGDFTNPVIAGDWSDPTVWEGGDGFYYSVATELLTIRRSQNLTDWEDMRRSPLDAASEAKLKSLTTNLWAPSVTRIGGKWLMYVSLAIEMPHDNRIAVLVADAPSGPFVYRGTVIESRRERILNTIDPFVTEADGRVWMFVGSCQDGVHRFELTADGLAIRPGTRPTHVAGVRNPGTFEDFVDIWGRRGTWEGAYALRRHGWWYLFVSGGKFMDHTYFMTVGRSRTIDGAFRDREGRLLTEGLAEPILRSDPGDRFFGPGHNGDVFADVQGRDWMFFHAHDAEHLRAPDQSETLRRNNWTDRPTLLQELKWTADDWPCFDGDKAQERPNAPLFLLRSYGSAAENPDFTDRIFAAQERHPGLIEEIWFGGCGDEFGKPEEMGREAARQNLRVKERCGKLGIAFSYQQGVTLNHSPDGVRREGFPEDAWAVDREGKIRYGLFCCTSPFVKDYCREKAKAIMAALKPASYWTDDDLRLNKLQTPSICFCARCLGLFGEKVGRTFDRAGLLAALTGPNAEPAIRRAWCAFNGESLGAYARVYREAADAVSPATRVCQQSPYSPSAVNGDAYRHILTAYDGNGVGTGVRPGGGYYSDQDPFSMLVKGACVARDAARTSRLPFVRQISYEAENWPHIGALKNPGGMMVEGAYVIALGCDSLALYWGADLNGESADSHDFFFDTAAAWKPFLRSLRDAFRGTLPGGVACFVGEGRFASDRWLLTMDSWQSAVLARNGVPVADQEAHPDAFCVNAAAVPTLAREDLPRVFAKPVLMDVAAFRRLAERFPDLAFAKKVRVDDPSDEKALATSARAAGFERFGAAGKCEGIKGWIRPLADDVVRLSEMTADPKVCGTCVIPTEFGGSVVLVQDMAFKAPGWAGWQQSWAGCRRRGILDALDRATPGGLPVRLLTDGYACVVVARTTRDGRTVGAFVMNMGTGETPPLELAIRRGVPGAWRLLRPRRAAEPVVPSAGAEPVVRLPPLPPFGVAAVVGER